MPQIETALAAKPLSHLYYPRTHHRIELAPRKIFQSGALRGLMGPNKIKLCLKRAFPSDFEHKESPVFRDK